MGNSIFQYLWGKKEVKILFIGLDAAGKTTILYTLKLGEVVTTIPTIGFNVETLKFTNVNMTAWDVGVRDKSRALLRHYYTNTQGLVYVIDSYDRERFNDAMDEISCVMKEDELRDVPVLILANKQDIEGAMTPEEITQTIQDKKCMNDRHWKVFGVIAKCVKDNGLQEAFEWLSNIMVASEKNKMASEMMSRNDKENNNVASDGNVEKNTKPFYCSFVESFKKMIT